MGGEGKGKGPTRNRPLRNKRMYAISTINFIIVKNLFLLKDFKQKIRKFSEGPARVPTGALAPQANRKMTNQGTVRPKGRICPIIIIIKILKNSKK